jgi:hypothetical protein
MSPILAFVLAASVAGTDSVRADRDVRLTALRNTRSIHRCYVDEGLRRQPKLEGVIEIDLTIEPTGIVSEVKVSSATLTGPGSREVAACIATLARQWRFDRGPYETETVVFPFVLRPQIVAEEQEAARRS